MMKSKVRATLCKTDLHSEITRFSKRNIELKLSENDLFSFLPGQSTTQFLCDYEHPEAMNHGSVT